MHDELLRGQTEDRILARRARDGDARASRRLAEKYLPLAGRLARRYRHSREPLEDLVQVARLGLVKAIARWDPDRGTTFVGFAVPTITGELRRYFRDSTWAVRPPRPLQELCLEVERAGDALRQELGRRPTAEELAARLGRDVEDVVEALSATNAYVASSLDAPVREDDPVPVARAELLVDAGRDLLRCEDAVTLDQLSAVLSRRDREIVRLRAREDLLQRDIAERLGCSQIHVSRVLRNAVERMQVAAGA